MRLQFADDLFMEAKHGRRLLARTMERGAYALSPGPRNAPAAKALALACAARRQPRAGAAMRQIAGHGLAGRTGHARAGRGAVAPGCRAVLQRKQAATCR